MSSPVSSVVSQPELPMMCLLEKPRPVDPSIVSAIGMDESALIRKAVELSRFKFLQKTYAWHLGVSESQFSKIKNGADGAGKKWHFPLTSVPDFECLVGHTLITQWIDYHKSMRLNPDLRELHEHEQRAAELRAKILGRAA